MSMDRNANENKKLIDDRQMNSAVAQEKAMYVMNTAENLIQTAGENSLQAGDDSNGDTSGGDSPP